MNPIDFIKEIAATLQVGIEQDDAHLEPLLKKINEYLASPEDCVVIPKDMFRIIIGNLKANALIMHSGQWKCVYCRTKSLHMKFPHTDKCLITQALSLLEDK